MDVSPDYTSISYRKNRAAVEFDDHLSLNHDDPLGEYLATDVTLPLLDECEKHSDEYDSNNDYDYEILEPLEEVDDIDREGFVDLGTIRQKFKIRSIINHIGSSASCGHYTANAFKLNKNEGRKDNLREWIKFNDSYVSSLNTDEAMGEQTQKSAYLLMYDLE